MKKFSHLIPFCSLVVLLALPAAAQTFEIGGQDAKPAPDSGRRPGAVRTSPSASGESSSGFGWGSSIEVGRNARAAEDALRKGNGAAATMYAERAVKAAPSNARLWFLLGYASRLGGRYQQSINAYQRGLSMDRNSIDGLSGMAQTYARMGRVPDAKRLLMRVIAQNPRRQNDLLMAGELFIQTGDLQQGVDLLSRAEAIRPSAHAEVMLAIAYMKLKQPAKARQMLESAKRRDPKNPTVFRAVANFYREQHDYKSAIATLKGAPQNADVLADLGYSYELNGNKQESADTYSKAAGMSPQEIGLQLSAAQAQIRVAAMDKARAFLARAESLDANHYRLFALRGQLAKAENRNADAVREYRNAIANLPREGVPEGQLFPIQLRLNLADIHREMGDDAGARQQIALAEQEVNKLQIEGPARAEFLRVRASIRMSANDIAGADRDLKEALKLDPGNMNIALQYANLLWRAKRKDEARLAYLAVLRKEPNNRYGLEAMGYLHRDAGDNKSAETWFRKLAAAYPDDYVAYLALGDLYTSIGDFPRADQSYQRAHKLAPTNPVVVANAANAAIEAQQIPLAASWVARAEGKMLDDPRVMRERERVLFHQGKYLESARLGYQVLEQLPNDRNASVYLAYALYNLGRFDDVLALTSRYSVQLPKEPNFPLLSGHVHKQNQLLAQAVEEYSAVLDRDPGMVEAYVNRGYVLNDMQNAEEAMQDFNRALELSPNNGVARLGLAFSNLQLRHGKAALDDVDAAEKLLGESGATHLVRATAFRQMRLLDRAERSYRAALKYAPDDLRLHLALADTQYHQRRYSEALGSLNDALSLSPDDPLIYAQMAHAHAKLGDRTRTYQYIEAAERSTSNSAGILLNTGEALLSLGDRDAAMDRFARAIEAPDANRVQARLAFARLFTRERRFEDARQQVALAFAEARVGESAPVTADDFVEAANLFLAQNDFDLASRYFERAQAAGAADEVVAIGMANTYIAQGDPNNAEAQLAALGSPETYQDNYDYTLAMANIYRQRRQTFRAMTAFARASAMGGQDDVAERGMQEVAGEEGVRVHPRVGVNTDFAMSGIFEDATIYNLDRQLFGAAGADLPTPRSSLETRWTNTYRVHPGGWPTVSGYFQMRNARGRISLPSESVIVDRNTYDYSFNGALNPVLRLGRSQFQFNTGLQFTWRRDKESPFEINQNLLRQFVYLTSNSLFNWLVVRGEAFHESGGFTQRDLSSRELGARVEFVVGRPWSRTRLLTGYSVRNLRFDPLVREFYSTTASIGVQRKFGEKLTAAVLGEYIRSWRVQGREYWIAQAARPAAELEYRLNNRWSFNGSFALSRGQGFHDYDNVQSSFLIHYVRPLRRMVSDGVEQVPVEYPIRLSFGIENANYYNFTGRDKALVRPIIRLSLF